MVVLRMGIMLAVVLVVAYASAMVRGLSMTPDYDKIAKIEGLGRDGGKLARQPKPRDDSAVDGGDSDDPAGTSGDHGAEPSDQAVEAERYGTPIELDAFREHYETGNLVIDARPASEFVKGHLDAPLIMNVPADEFHAHLQTLEGFRGMPIAIYCTSLECDLAEELYYELEKLGYTDMSIYRPGWQDGILEHGLPTTTAPGLN